VEDTVPEAAGDTEAVFVVGKVVLQVVLLQFLVEGWKLLVVEEIMRHVVADVAENTTTVHSRGSVPIIEEDGVGEVPEWRSENHEQRRRHDQAQSVHGKVMVDTVEQEVQRDSHTIVRKMVIKVEEATVQAILDQSPDAKPSNPISSKGECAQPLRSEVGAICDRRHPDCGNNPPWSLAQRFQEIAEQRSRFASLVMTRPVHLLEIKFLAETTIEDLHQKRLVQVEEFVIIIEVCAHASVDFVA